MERMIWDNSAIVGVFNLVAVISFWWPFGLFAALPYVTTQFPTLQAFFVYLQKFIGEL
jgi:hypothetical protein